MTGQREAATVLLLQRGMGDFITEENKKSRAAAAALFKPTESAVASVPDGNGGEIELGKVTMAKGSKSARLIDKRAFMAWMIEHRPALVDQPANPAVLSDALTVVAGGFLKRTPVSAILIVLDAAEQELERMRDDYRAGPSILPSTLAAILKEIAASGGLTNKETGEVQTVPGVERYTSDPQLKTFPSDDLGRAVQSILGGLPRLAIEPPEETP